VDPVAYKLEAKEHLFGFLAMYYFLKGQNCH